MTEVSAAQTNKKWHDRVVVPYGHRRTAIVGADDCCGTRNLYAALTAASNFDRCHSFLLAVSATGGARKRPSVRPKLPEASL